MNSYINEQHFQYQLVTSKQASNIVQFHNSYYGTARRPIDWLWEYKTYKPTKSVFVSAKVNEKIVATQGMLPIYIQIRGKLILSGKSENTLLLPEYRGTGVMKKLYEFAVENCIANEMQFLWGFTTAVKAFESYGFQSFEGVQLLARRGDFWIILKTILNNGSPLRRRVVQIGKLILKISLSLQNVTLNQFNCTTEYELRRELTYEDDLKDLFDRLALKNKNAIFIKYDKEYLKWRVREHPFIKYIEYQVYSSNSLKAFAIVSLSNNILSISDLTSEDNNATGLLLNTILKDFNKKAIEFRILINTQDILNQDVLRQLFKFGFSAGNKWNFIVRNLIKDNNDDIFNIHNWHINGLWTEGYAM